MCGAYNHNVIKKAEEIIKGEEHYKLFIVGELDEDILRTRRKISMRALDLQLQNQVYIEQGL